MAEAPVVLLPGGGHRIDMGGGFAMVVKASGPETGGAFSLLESDEPADLSPPMHIHRDAAESFYVIAGEYTMFIAGEETVCAAGSFVYVPKGVEHTFRVGPSGGSKLNIYTPAAMVGYFDELSAFFASGSNDEAELGAIAGRYAMEIVGPVPDSYH